MFIVTSTSIGQSLGQAASSSQLGDCDENGISLE